MHESDIARIAHLASAPAEVFWRECFLRCAYTREKPLREMYRLGVQADECGRRYGRELRPAEKSVLELCEEYGLEIRELAMPESPEMEIFALFEPPARIFVRTALLTACDRFVRDSGLDAALGRFCCMDVVLCHELFHFFETRESRTVFTRAYREPVGLFRRRTALPPLSEIAAMGFAQEVLGLKWSPFLLDCVLLGMSDATSALAVVERLERSAAEYAQGSPV